jgi:uncharacterized membrane protein (DUF4010 family)
VVTVDATSLLNLGVAVLGGLAVGIERQWSGHAVGPKARFAGVRTFTLLGLVSGLSGWLWMGGLQGPAIILLAGLGALVVVAYVAASRRDVDGTTEVGAFVVMAAGVLSGSGYRAVASGIIALTVLLLFEKKRLHRFVSALDRVELRAGARFAVMATVVLPLLPEGPFGPLGGVRPRLLWGLVLFFSGLSFAGYLARRTIGRDRGYAVSGTLGGIISSTNTTLTLSRLSRTHPASGLAIAAGVMGANMVLLPRVLIASAVIAPALALAAWPAFLAPAAVGAAILLVGWRRARGGDRLDHDRNPLQVVAALQMALLFQAVLFGVSFATSRLGTQGLYASAVVLGLVDMDALTISLARETAGGVSADVTARALTIGVLSNTFVKLGIALVLGHGAYRRLAAFGLALMAALLGAAVAWYPFQGIF